jgi:enterobactin synthetase component D
VHRLESLFDGLASTGAVVALAAPIVEDWEGALTSSERALVERAVDKRRREFATGRRLARAALAELGMREVELLNGRDRAPLWPHGVSGSISHSDHCAVVAVAHARHGTLGVDVEHRSELKRELWSSVFLEREIATLDACFEEPVRGRMALVLFSAKEALYKAQYPRTSTFMGFHELHVAVEADHATGGRLVCTFQNDVGEASAQGAEAAHPARHRFSRGEVAHGRYLLEAAPGAEVVTSVFIPR